MVAIARELPKRFWNANAKCWNVPAVNLDAVQKAFPDFEYDAEITAKLDEARSAAAAERAEKEKITADLLERIGDLSAPQADGRVLYAHQREAVMQMIRGQHSILADDMGLAKHGQRSPPRKPFNCRYSSSRRSRPDNGSWKPRWSELQLKFFVGKDTGCA
jgi:hypothetical protein